MQGLLLGERARIGRQRQVEVGAGEDERGCSDVLRLKEEAQRQRKTVKRGVEVF